MHAALVIAGKDLRQRFRDRSAIVLGIIAPIVISGLMTLAFRQTASYHFTAGFVDRDHGPVATAFRAMLDDPGIRRVVTIRQYADEAAARAAVDAGTTGAALVVPAGFSAAAHGGSARPVRVLTSAKTVLDGEVTQSLAESFVAQLNADRLSVATAIAAGADPTRAGELTAAAARLQLPATVREVAAGGNRIKAISYYAPGMATFFVLFAIGFGSRSYFVEGTEGTLDRIAAAPLRRGVILVGKSLSTFVYAVVSLATLTIVSTLAFGASWGSPVAVALLCLAMAVAVVALTAFVITLARTERQAEGVSSIVVFALALLGGNFVFVSVAPPIIRRLSLYTPNGWALRGFTDLAAGEHALGTVAVPVLAILAFSAVIAAVTAVLFHRTVPS